MARVDLTLLALALLVLQLVAKYDDGSLVLNGLVYTKHFIAKSPIAYGQMVLFGKNSIAFSNKETRSLFALDMRTNYIRKLKPTSRETVQIDGLVTSIFRWHQLHLPNCIGVILRQLSVRKTNAAKNPDGAQNKSSMYYMCDDLVLHFVMGRDKHITSGAFLSKTIQNKPKTREISYITYISGGKVCYYYTEHYNNNFVQRCIQNDTTPQSLIYKVGELEDYQLYAAPSTYYKLRLDYDPYGHRDRQDLSKKGFNETVHMPNIRGFHSYVDKESFDSFIYSCHEYGVWKISRTHYDETYMVNECSALFFDLYGDFFYLDDGDDFSKYTMKGRATPSTTVTTASATTTEKMTTETTTMTVTTTEPVTVTTEPTTQEITSERRDLHIDSTDDGALIQMGASLFPVVVIFVITLGAGVLYLCKRRWPFFEE